MVRHGLAQGGDHLAAEDDVLLHRRVPQVQIAVLEALGLVGLPAAVHLEGQLIVAAAAQDLHLLRDHLDVAGGELGVLAGPLPDCAFHGDGGLFVDGLELGHHLRRLRHDLSGAVEVPKDDEGQLGADLPDVLHPAGEFDGLPGVGEAELAAGVGAVLYHDGSSFLLQNGIII